MSSMLYLYFITKALLHTLNKQKSSDFSARAIIYLQFPFVFHRFQSLQLLPPIHLCLHLSIQHFRLSTSQISLFRFLFLPSRFIASFRLPQSWILTTQPLFLLFPSLPDSV